MAEFNYIEYLRNNPLLKSEGRQSLTENQKPGYNPDGTPKSDAEMTDDEREEFYLDLDDISEEKAFTKMKVSELKAKIKEDIIATLAEQDEDYEQASREIEYNINPEADEIDFEDLEAAGEYYDNMNENDLESELMTQLDEAKEDEEDEEEVEDEDFEEEDVEVEDTESESDTTPQTGLTPEESQIQDSLKVAYDNAVSMGDEKLADQIGNSITFFTRTHIVER